MSEDLEDSEMRCVPDNCVDSETPLNEPLSARYKRSFAYITMKDRLPIILTQVVDHLSRDKEKIINEYGKESLEELKIVIGKFSKLKNELQTNKPLIPLQSNATDIAAWNTYLQQLREDGDVEPRWFYSPWMDMECYMYRRAREAFEMTEYLIAFDPFQLKKQTALNDSFGAISILVPYIMKLLQPEKCRCSEDVKNEFIKLLYVDLWGNRCDLSLSAGGKIVIEEDPLQKIEELSEFILQDEADKIWKALEASRGNSDVIVDIVLDNSGYELFTDLCLADFMVTYSLATHIRFRAKVMPWYVSDVCKHDFHWTLQTLSNSENPTISALARRWTSYMDSEKWLLSTDEFWTLPYVFSKMQCVDPALYQDLSKSVLLIFKGDLNYRKLTGDINWETTKPFCEALCGFQPTNIAALRTLKADTICGLSLGQAKDVEAKSPDWLVTGQYAVIQFSSI